MIEELTPHPRLFAGREELGNLCREPTMPAMVRAHSDLLKHARQYVRSTELTGWGAGQDPSGLGAAREMVDRIITLVTAFRKTDDERYRRGALRDICALDEMKSGGSIGDGLDRGFWLSDGEECAGIAIAYDWLYDSLSLAEQRMLVELCRRRLLALGQAKCRKGGEWWFAKRFSNWNAVCAGGLGMLCLAMYDDCPEPREILPHVEEALREFMIPLEETDGGWPEGLGYWNYGMAYAFQYLMSWERSVGKVHPLMRLPATSKTLAFPFDFYPNAMSAGFGDNNNYHPTPFHYAAARRLDQELVMGAIDRQLVATGEGMGGLLGGSATFCVQHPGTVTTKFKTESQVAKVYDGLGWGMIADGMPNPSLYLAMRGGDTSEEHTHVDLLSFRVLVGREWLIENGRGGQYLQPTYFSSRRTEINDINATYKNTIFINGVGVPPGSVTDRVEAVRGQGCYGVRMVATTAMARHVGGLFCGRLALMVHDSAIVVIDRTRTRGIARTESRMHSYQDVTFGKTGAMIRGEQESLRVTYASLEKAGLFRATTAPATPTNPNATMLRWCPLRLHEEAVLVTLLTPGRRRAAAAVARDGKGLLVTLTVNGRTKELRLRPNLTLL